MGMCRNSMLDFDKRIRMFCILAAVLKVSGTFAQADFCSKGISYMNNCLNEIGVLSKNTTEMPVNIKELDIVCRDFRKGMKCLQDFAVACLQKTKRESFEDHFGPAMYIMKQLCDNHNLRQEYLKHPECHKEMSPEWGRCSKPLVDLVHGNAINTKDSSEDKIFQICCAKYCFLDCINRVSRLKCVPDAANMHRDLAASLSGSLGNQYNCTYSTVQLINSTICKSTCSRSHRNSSNFGQVICFLFTYFLFYKWRK